MYAAILICFATLADAVVTAPPGVLPGQQCARQSLCSELLRQNIDGVAETWAITYSDMIPTIAAKYKRRFYYQARGCIAGGRLQLRKGHTTRRRLRALLTFSPED